MPFGCANFLKRLREPDEEDVSHTISGSYVATPDTTSETEIAADAVDALNLILSTVCDINSEITPLNTGSFDLNPLTCDINTKISSSEIHVNENLVKQNNFNSVTFDLNDKLRANENVTQMKQESFIPVTCSNNTELDVTKIPEDVALCKQETFNPVTCDNNAEDDCAIIAEFVAVNDSESKNDIFTHEDQDCQSSNEIQSSDGMLDFSAVPIQITGAWSEFSNKQNNNYTRGCKWAPDGSCILTCTNDNILRLFNLPVEVWDFSKWQDISEMKSVLKTSEGELIYDFCWYPMMTSSDPSTCCFASCSRNSTVHLWDAFSGDLRCSYRAYDQMDEITAARSLSFDSDGGKIYCGFEKAVRVFDTNLPGRKCYERKTFAKKSGQSGIISSFAFTSANRNISAAGSYGKTIGIYAEPDGSLECVLEGQKGGITYLQFSPDGNLLYSGGRKDNDILCWDMRNLGEVLYCMRRKCPTNQRMYFDLSRDGRYLITGNVNGVITVWDTWKEAKEANLDDFSLLEPAQYFLAHNDCVNGISINPSYPLLCSSSGQRKFFPLLSDDEDEMFASETEQSDNSLRLWWIGRSS